MVPVVRPTGLSCRRTVRVRIPPDVGHDLAHTEVVPRRNRIDPLGDLHAVSARGLFTGNRGCLVDEDRQLVRHHRGNLWIICVTSFRGWRHELDKPNRWTPLFFLDDAVALAAGHRPCGFCRLDDHRAYRSGVTTVLGRGSPVRADELNRRLASERLRRGGGLDRGGDRRTWESSIDELPDGAVILAPDAARLVVGQHTMAFAFDGWRDPLPRQPGEIVQVLTPPTSVAALRGGFRPVLHPSAAIR
jgi:hypothetical protein